MALTTKPTSSLGEPSEGSVVETMEDREDPSPARLVPVRRGRRQAEVAELGTPTDKAPSVGCLEVESLREQACGISWEPVVSAPPEIWRSALSDEQWSLVEALYELGVLSGGQIQREFMGSIGERHLRRELSRMRATGTIQRGWLHGAKGTGRGKQIYVLAGQGFALLRDDPGHPASGDWRRPMRRSAQHVVHDLSRNEWLFAFRSLAPRELLGFRGPPSGKIEVPLVRELRAPGRPLIWADLREQPPIGLVSNEFSNIVPDLTLELKLEEPDGEQIRTDLLIEIEWANNNETVRRKALAYDALLSGWWQEHSRYRALGRPPKVCFAVPDLPRASRFIKILDKALQGHVRVSPRTQTRAENAQGIIPATKNVYLGRQNIFVAVARDVHQRTLRAWRVPAAPPEQRAGEARNAHARRDAGRAIPRQAQLLDSRELIDLAT